MINNKLNDKIKNFNDGKAYKIKCRKIKDNYSLFLEYRRKGMRKTENLNLYLTGKVTRLKEDKRILERAREKQNIFEDMLKKKNSEDKEIILKADVVRYFEKIAKNYKIANTRKVWNNTISHLKKYIETKRGSVTFKDIDVNFWGGFKNYLLENNVSPNSAYTYFSIVKTVLYKAMDKGLPYTNKPVGELNLKTTDSNRQYLTQEELEALLKTPPPNKQVANAFLFSCFTGLRLSDIKDFTFEKIYIFK